jgi:hypothetical protein
MAHLAFPQRVLYGFLRVDKSVSHASYASAPWTKAVQAILKTNLSANLMPRFENPIQINARGISVQKVAEFSRRCVLVSVNVAVGILNIQQP